MGQRFQRALQWNPTWKNEYGWLSETEKRTFRLAWSLSKNFQFTKESKKVVRKHSQSESEVGVYLPECTIASRLGGGPEAAKLAANYKKTALTIGGKFVAENTWLDCQVFLFIQKLVTSTTSTDWIMESESYSIENHWEASSTLNKARRKYAAVHMVKAEAVTEEMLRDSAMGIKGWAEMSVHVQLPGQRTPAPANKAIEAGKGGGKSKAGKANPAKPKDTKPKDNSIAKAEKELKDLLGRHTQASLLMKKLADRKSSDTEDDWTWADGFFKMLENNTEDFNSLHGENAGFLGDFKAAALTAAGMRVLKKTKASPMPRRS